MNFLKRISLILLCAVGAHASRESELRPISEKRVMVDFSFYYENSEMAYRAMETMKVGDKYENIAVQFYEFMSSGRYDVFGYNEYMWACDLTTYCMDMSTSYLRLDRREKATEWLALARKHATPLRPVASLESRAQTDKLDEFILKLTAKWAEKRAAKGESRK